MVGVSDGWVDGWGYFLVSCGGFWSSSGLTFALSLHHMFSPAPTCQDPLVRWRDETPPQGLPLVATTSSFFVQQQLDKCLSGMSHKCLSR